MFWAFPHASCVRWIMFKFLVFIPRGSTPRLRMCDILHISYKGWRKGGGSILERKNFLASLQNFYNEVVSNRKRGKPQWHNVKTLPWWWSLGKRFLLKHVFVQELVQSRRPNPYHWFNIFWNILWKQTQHCRLNICQYNRYIETAVMSRKHCQRPNGPNGCVHLPE